MASNRHNWATSSVPGSLSGKYGNGDQIIEENESLGNLEDDAITKKDANKHPKRKPAKPISDDGVITTISQQEGTSNDDKASSVMSLSDKYRTQEEIEIFQVHNRVLITLVIKPFVAIKAYAKRDEIQYYHISI